jgi:hypothetical protein
MSADNGDTTVHEENILSDSTIPENKTLTEEELAVSETAR